MLTKVKVVCLPGPECFVEWMLHTELYSTFTFVSFDLLCLFTAFKIQSILPKRVLAPQGFLLTFVEQLPCIPGDVSRRSSLA